MKKLIGIIFIYLSLQILSMNIMLAQIALYLDPINKSYSTKLSTFIPNVIYIIFLISISLGIYLIVSDRKGEHLNKQKDEK